MDKVIRIGSQQGFAAQWDNTVAPSALNLVDFEIPAGMIIDMTKSYVAFNTEIQPQVAAGTPGVGGTNAFATDDPINAMISLNNLKANGEMYEAPNSALIRNARISCDKGQIESMRRIDTLKSSLFNIEHDSEERKDDMNAFVAPKSVRGVGNQTSLFLDWVNTNTDAAGNALVGADSRQLARDVKVPLKSVFGIAEGADAWDTSKFGTTRIHMETNWKTVKAQRLGGSEDVSKDFLDTTTFWGSAEAINGVPATGAAGDALTAFTLSYPFTDFNQHLPFFVGQKIIATCTSDHAGTGTTSAPAVIATMQYDATAEKVNVTTVGAWFTNLHAGAVNLSDILIKADNSYVPSITVNRAELVLFTRPEMDTPDEYQYVTYTTEEDNGNGITSFARGYTMEGEAEQMIVCLAPSAEILPTTAYESYRYAVNNEDQTGNRSISVGSPLQYDRLTRAMDNQYTDWRNAQLRFSQITPIAPTQANMYDAPNSTIPETLPLSTRAKYVDLQIECAAGVDDIRIYKQMVRTIRA